MSWDFDALLFGSGNLIGLMILITVNIFLIGTKNKAKGLIIPLNLLFAYEYYTHGQDFAWHGIIMMLLCFFNLLSLFYSTRK